MTPHPLPHSTRFRHLRRLASLRALPGGMLRAAAAALGLGATVGTVLAEPPAASAPVRPAGVADAMLSRTVLLALDRDPILRRVNIVVSIVDGVAVIGGPVSSAAISKRAEELVRGVPGIAEVRNGCFVVAGPDPLLIAVAEKMKPSTLPPRPVLTGLPGVAPTPGAPALGAQVAFGPGGSTVVAQKIPQTGDGMGTLGAPVGAAGAGMPAAPVRDPSVVPATAPGRLTSTVAAPSHEFVGDILTSAANVKKLEARFAKLTVEYKDGDLLIGGVAPKASDAWDLAEKLRQIPGVSRVIVQ